MNILAAFLLAVVITLAFTPGYRSRQSSMAPLGLFFFVLFLIGIAAQYWIVPFGPKMWGISWIPLLFLVLLFSFVFAAPSPYRGWKAKEERETEEAVSAIAAVSIFVWLLFLLLIVAILIGVFRTPLPTGIPLS